VTYSRRGLAPGADDLLIARSARSIGAAVVTSRVRHFGAIREIRRFPPIILPT
jgi:predicted nucleic acid-binding protein